MLQNNDFKECITWIEQREKDSKRLKRRDSAPNILNKLGIDQQFLTGLGEKMVAKS